MFLDFIGLLIGGYVVYRQETIERSVNALREEVRKVKDLMPKRSSDHSAG